MAYQHIAGFGRPPDASGLASPPVQVPTKAAAGLPPAVRTVVALTGLAAFLAWITWATRMRA